MSRNQKTFAENRRRVMQDLPDGLIFLAGDELTTRNHDVSYLFRQDSNFLYLTGVEEPGYALALNPKSGKEVLFMPRVTQHHRVWEGDVPGPEEHVKLYGIPEVRFLDELPKVLPKLGKRLKALYTDAQGAKLLRRAKLPYKADRKRFEDSLSFCRAEKTRGEIKLMQYANTVSGRGHVAAMAAAAPGLYEYQVQAAMEAEFKAGGLKHQAYPSIVATGKNGACLHYRDNDAKLKKNDLLLIDAGGEYKGYAADITRTFPVSGTFSRVQRDVYEIVLAAQKACIAGAINGVRNSELHRLSQMVLAAGLKDMGVIKCRPDEAVDSDAIRMFYPHGLGHMLGLDVHDCTGGKRHKLPGPKPKNLRFDSVLRPGMVITIEPGLYFIPALLEDKELRGKHKDQVAFSKADRLKSLGGIRIEDDVVIQKKGPPLNLTSVPKEVADVEAACRGEWEA